MGTELLHSFSISQYLPSGITAAVHLPSSNLLLIGSDCDSNKDSSADARAYGLTGWCVDSGLPSELLDVRRKLYPPIWKRFRMWTASAGFVVKIELSPDGSKLLVLDSCGGLSLWTLPSLQLLHNWSSSDIDLPKSELVDNPRKRKLYGDNLISSKLVDIAFWSNDVMVLAHCCGLVSLVHVDSLELLGDQVEWFFPNPKIVAADSEKVFCLECLLKEGDSSSDEDPSYLHRLVSRFVGPPAKKRKLVQRVYRIAVLESATPEQLYAKKIEAGEFGEAVLLARSYGLDTDLVYQKQWRIVDISNASINDYLDKVKKQSWVLNECLNRVPDNIDVAKSLLEYGLKRTAGVKDDIGDTLEGREVRKCRHRLQQYLRRLHTYNEILGGMSAAEESFDPRYFDEFRKRDIVDVALDFARDADILSVEIILSFHWDETLSHRLEILANFPESTPVADYEHLLPGVVEGEVHWRFEEQPISDEWEYDSSFQTAESVTFDETALSQWYHERTCEIERRSRSVKNAIALISFGMENGVTSLSQLHNDLLTMSTLVYDCRIDFEYTFEDVQKLSDIEKVHLLLDDCSEGDFIAKCRRRLLLFLDRYGGNTNLLHRYIEDVSKSDLTKCVLLLEDFYGNHDDRIIDDEEMAFSMGVDAIFACENENQLMKVTRTLDLIGPMKVPDTSSVRFDHLNDLFKAAETLHWHDFPQTIRYLDEVSTDVTSSRNLLTKFVRGAGRSDRSMSEDDWSSLFTDMLQLQHNLFSIIPVSDCYTIFLENLLCCGNLDDMQSARKFLSANLIADINAAVIEDLVVKAAREYFNSAKNLSDPCMQLCYECLHLVSPPSQKVQDELDLLQAVRILDDFNIDVLPLQVRLSNNRFDFIRRAASSRYQSSDELVHLAMLLKVASKEDEIRNTTHHLCVQAAIENQDLEIAYELCKKLMDAGFADVWKECMVLFESYESLPAKLHLLSFSAAHCPADMLKSILVASSLLSAKTYCDAISDQVPSVSEPNPFLNMPTLDVLNSPPLTTAGSNSEWWSSVLRASSESEERSSSAESLSFETFYESIHPNQSPPSSLSYRSYNYQRHPSILDLLLRAARLKQLSTGGGTEDPALFEQMIQRLVKRQLRTDTALSISYALCLSEHLDAVDCLSGDQLTTLSLTMSIYYCALLLASKAKVKDFFELTPRELVDHVTSITDYPDESCTVVVEQLEKLRRTLSDLKEASLLQNFNIGTDITRFAEDADYKRDTVLGMTLTTDEQVVQTALSIARKSDMSTWELLISHLEYIFCSSFGVADIQDRMQRLDILQSLMDKKLESKRRLEKFVYPSITGDDHKRLMLYFDIIEQCDLEDATIKSHIRALKKIQHACPDLDFKLLLTSDNPKEVIRPLLRQSNVHILAKLADKIIRAVEPSLHDYDIYLMYCEQYFWTVGDSDNCDLWLTQYDKCSAFLKRLLPEQYVSFVSSICYSERIASSCRVRLLDRALEQFRVFSRKQQSKWACFVGQLHSIRADLSILDSEFYKFVQKHQPGIAERVRTSIGDPDILNSLASESLQLNVDLDCIVDLVAVSDRPLSLYRILKTCLSDLNSEPEVKLIEAVAGLLTQPDDVPLTPEQIEELTSDLCSFSKSESIDIHTKLEIVTILESYNMLDKDSLIFCQTMSILAASWDVSSISDRSLATENDRKQLFLNLLEDAKHLSQFISLKKLLISSWPPFENDRDTSLLWRSLIQRILSNLQVPDVGQIVSSFICDIQLNPDVVEATFNMLLLHEHFLEAAKVAISSKLASLVTRASDALRENAILGDDEIIQLVLEHNLVVQFAESPCFEQIVDRLKEQQNPDAIETVCDQLRRAGLDSAANHLQSTALPRQTSLGSLMNWWGKS